MLAEVRTDRTALVRRLREALAYESSASSLSAEQAATAALSMERAYTALESIIERVTRALEGDAPTGDDWHRRLLEGAVMAIHKVRPALLSPAAHALAGELLRFRHFLRHAYGADLEPLRVGTLVSRLGAGMSVLTADLDALERFLAAMADELEL